jgi:predicted ATPase/class 3 adenylate cyclase
MAPRPYRPARLPYPARMQPARPSGFVSFLFTDVEGSTRLWEHDPEAMAASLALHDEILRRGASSKEGHVFSTAGDAFAVAFATPEEALEAALDVQRQLLAAAWPGPALRVRMGIHTGVAEERDGDYFGPVLNRAARIMASGHGGQVMVSATTAAAAKIAPPVRLADRGIHHLKDLDAPEHLFELRHPDLPVVDRPVRSVEVRHHNLPDYLTSFVGRVRELEELEHLVRGHRLTVLTGVGGTGKTRLAVEAARRSVDSLPDGAWLVELAPITDPSLVMTAIGDVWGLRPGEGASIEEVVSRFLWSKELLLVVDNCEHLLDAAADAVRRILNAAPKVRIVATSRESLGIPGESGMRVPSLGLPDATHPRDAESVLLFLDRAAAVLPDVEWSDADLEAIGRICRRIDGIPLGLELAAARLRSMTIGELAGRLEDSFRILSGSAKAALPRQRTLHATIDWSYDLLEPAERAVFERLSMFAGGFDLAAAEAVCAQGSVERWEVLDRIDSLVDKSLVVSAPHAVSGTRYRMLEPVRQHAQERLVGSGDSATVIDAHARHFAAFVAEAAPRTRGPEQFAWDRRLDLDYDNVRVALRTLLETGDLDRYLDLAFDLYAYWMHTGKHIEGIAAGLAGLSAAPDGSDPHRLLRVWWTTAGLGAQITDPVAVEHARAGLVLAEQTGDPNAVAKLRLQLGFAIRHATTDPAYLEHLVEGRRLLDAHPEPHWWEPEWERGLLNLFLAEYLPVDDPRLREHLDTALAAFRGVGDEALEAAVLFERVGLWGTGEDDRIMEDLTRAIEAMGRLDLPYWHGHALMIKGVLLRDRGASGDGAVFLAEAAGRLQDVGDLACWATSLRGLARVEAELGHHARAVELMGMVLEATPRLPMPEVVRPRTLDTLAEVLTAAGEHRHAAVVLGCAEVTEFPMTSIMPRIDHAGLRSRLAEQLGAGVVDELCREGAALDPDDCLARARDWLARPDVH